MSSLFTNAIAGISNTYSTLSSKYTNGITLENLLSATKDTTVTSNVNTSFLNYLKSNFSSIDKDNDGKISSNDISNLMNNINNQGMTYNEIAQLCANNGLGDSSLLSTVLTYFNQIDADKDGKVTNSEIQQFKTKAQAEKIKNEYGGFKPSSMSVFYDDGLSNESTSILDGLYPDVSSL